MQLVLCLTLAKLCNPQFDLFVMTHPICWINSFMFLLYNIKSIRVGHKNSANSVPGKVAVAVLFVYWPIMICLCVSIATLDQMEEMAKNKLNIASEDWKKNKPCLVTVSLGALLLIDTEIGLVANSWPPIDFFVCVWLSFGVGRIFFDFQSPKEREANGSDFLWYDCSD